MTTARVYMKRHPLMSYFTLTFVVSWGCLLLVIGSSAFLGKEVPSEELMPLMFLAMIAGPSVAGILMTGIVTGKAGLREFQSRMLRWRVNARWYIVALLAAPILMSAVLLLLSITSSDFLPGIISSDGKVALLLSGIAGGLVAGIFEEIGWTGFAVPEMRRRYGILGTGLTVGVIWGAWHFPLFSGSASTVGGISPTLYLFVLLFSVLPAFRVLMVWVYEHTGSLLLVILMHVSLTASTMSLQPQGAGTTIVIFDLVLAVLLWGIIASVSVIQRRSRAAKSA